MRSTTIFGQNLSFTEDAREQEVRELEKKTRSGNNQEAFNAFMKILKIVDERLDKELPLTPAQKTTIGKMRLKTPSWSSSQHELTASFAQEVITKQTTAYLRENFDAFRKASNIAETVAVLQQTPSKEVNNK